MTVFGRSPELQKRIDEYHVLEQKEVERIKSEYPTETVDQMVERLRVWQDANDFIAFVKLKGDKPPSPKIKQMQTALIHAQRKLMLYREAHSGEYIGGVEYTQLIAEIDAALKD